MKSIKVFFVSVAALIIAFTMAGCGGSNIKTEPGDAGVKIVKSGYTIAKNIRDDRFLNCGFIIQNASTDTAYEDSKVVITAYDKNGDVLVTNNRLIRNIQPEEKEAGECLLKCNVEEVDNVKFKIEPGKKVTPSEDEVKSSDFKISGTKEHVNEYDDYTVITGKIKSKYPAKYVFVTVLFEKKGEIVYADTGARVKDLAAGQEKEFESNSYLVPEHDTYEVFAQKLY